MDSITEWRNRIYLLAGNLKRDEAGITSFQKMKKHYQSLTVEKIDLIKYKYKPDYFISEALYKFPILFTSGSWKVYSLIDKIK